MKILLTETVFLAENVIDRDPICKLLMNLAFTKPLIATAEILSLWLTMLLTETLSFQASNVSFIHKTSPCICRDTVSLAKNVIDKDPLFSRF